MQAGQKLFQALLVQVSNYLINIHDALVVVGVDVDILSFIFPIHYAVSSQGF